jgi:hypothetical protein
VFIFVVEAADDPAVAALQDMMAQQQQQQQQLCGKLPPQQQQLCGKPPPPQQQQQVGVAGLAGSVLHSWQQGPQQVVLLLNAGLAQTCSQKIHK